uniref:Putative secreted protein n=1 Tax=Anopheles darlingi TaxID=43151 RepID=A0A2M4DGF5_ANODA
MLKVPIFLLLFFGRGRCSRNAENNKNTRPHMRWEFEIEQKNARIHGRDGGRGAGSACYAQLIPSSWED